MGSMTIKDVAQAAGVSTATVSRVLNKNGYVSQEVRRHVEQVMRSMNYQPNVLARSLKQERTRTVGIVLPDMTNGYFMTAASRVQQRLLEIGYHLIYMDSGDDPVKELEAIQLLQGMRIEALILAGTGYNAQLLQHLMQGGTSVVLLDRTVDGVQTDQVVEDNVAAAEQAAHYLLEKYGARIGILRGPEVISTARERMEGVRRALQRKGLQAEALQREELQREESQHERFNLPSELIYQGDYTRRSGVEAGRYFMSLDTPPAAIFSANNEMTYGFYLGLKACGIPLDAVEVVSFGELDAAALFQHRLSVIRQNPEQIGEAVAELTCKRLEQKGREHEKWDCERRMFTPRFEKQFS